MWEIRTRKSQQTARNKKLGIDFISRESLKNECMALGKSKQQELHFSLYPQHGY